LVDVEQEEDLELLHSSLRPVLLVGKRSRVFRGRRQHGGSSSELPPDAVALLECSIVVVVVSHSSGC
jgi:hypothetical protein